MFDPAQIRQRRLSLCLILLAAIAIMAPELVTGLTVTDSFRFNLIWAQQFADSFRHGQLYPRWLPLSWDGLGSPTFYFYPPLFFWIAALVDALAGGAIAAERFVPIASLIALCASGLAMRAWLKLHVREEHARLGAVAYLIAPYHLYDIYARGALSEATAYAFVPIVMLTLARLREGRMRYLPLLSGSYAALVFSHLPSTLLATLFLVMPYALFLAARGTHRIRFVVCALIGGAVGIGLAAIFILPALGLLQFASQVALSSAFYRPESWFFWNYYQGPMGQRMTFIIPFAIAAFLLAASSLFHGRKSAARRELMLWSSLTMVLVLLIAGLVPLVWKAPGLVLVQFPWRALPCVEFAAITALAISFPRIAGALTLAGIAFLAAAYSVLMVYIHYTVTRTARGLEESTAAIRVYYRDAAEYLPVGTHIVLGAGPDENRVDLPIAIPLASAPGAAVKAFSLPNGGMKIAVDAPVPVRVKLRRFYFPHWRLTDANDRSVPIQLEPKQRVVTFDAPPGRSTFRLEPGTAPYERLGGWISLASLLLLLVVAGVVEFYARAWSRRDSVGHAKMAAPGDGGRGRV
jgi:hypothetical protein